MDRINPRFERPGLQPKKLLLSLFGAFGYLMTWPFSVTAAMEPLTSPVMVLSGDHRADVGEMFTQSKLQPQEHEAIESFLHEALKLARSFTDPQDRLYAFIYIARIYQTLGAQETALRLLETAVPLTQADVYGQVEIARGYVDADQPQIALSLLQNALHHAVISNSDDNGCSLTG